MKPSREEALVQLALSKPAAKRAAWLDAECEGDAALRARLDALLAAHEPPETVLAAGADAVRLREDASARPARPAIKLDLADTPDEAVGQTLGRYKLLERVGEGGCGTVYVAEQTEPVRRRVALKVIKLGMDTKQVVARFEAERQALAMMDHPNIAKVLDAGTTGASDQSSVISDQSPKGGSRGASRDPLTTDHCSLITGSGRPYFVMELVRGIKITDYCNQADCTTRERLDLFIKICQAIQHAHQKGIIHRDIKPSNILVTLHDGVPVPKVIDFGIAKATEGRLTDSTVYTQLHQFIGTPAYMSPEQAEMSGLDIDTRSDIYSLGVLLYELLAGSTPFDPKELMASGIDAMRKTIREKEPVRPSTKLSQTLVAADVRRLKSPATETPSSEEEVRASSRRLLRVKETITLLKGDLDWIVMKCLEKDRQRRYDTANGLAADIRRHLAHEAVIARPPSAAYKFQKAWRRNKLVFTAGTAVGAALVIGVAASAWQAVRANRMLNELRAAAPAFAEQARALAAKDRFAEAIEKMDYAVKLRPDVAEFLVAKGDLLECQLKLAEAAAAYRAALRLNPDFTRAEASARLCDELLAAKPNDQGKLTRESLAKLYLAMQQQQRPAAELMPIARLLDEERKIVVAYWLARLEALSIAPQKPLAERLTLRDDGRLALDLSGTKVTDLAPLAGAPLAVLDVSNCKSLTDVAPLAGIALVELNLGGSGVAGLTPLREMHTLKKLNVSSSTVIDLAPLSALRLEDVDLSVTQIADLSALRGMRLKRLNLRSSRVTDLSPLAGMPLAWFNASSTPALDFSPLADAPLEKCVLQDSPLRDLSFLRNSPVKELSLFDCIEARGFGVLQSLKSLSVLVLPQSYRSLPEEDLAALGALRDHPTLRNINAEYGGTGWSSLHTTPSRLNFWDDWDREQDLLTAIRAKGLKFSLSKLAGGTYALVVHDQPIPDLSLLNGLPISELSLFGCSLNDLTPLRDLPLEFLNIPNNPITDLSPLRGMKIKTLHLAGTKVSDLAPLKTLPIQGLFLDRCENVADVAELAKLPTLEYLTVPLARNIEALRKLPKLQRLGFRIINTSPYVPETTPGEFWQYYDANRWINSLLNGDFRPNLLRQLEDGTWEVNLDSQPVTNLELFRGAPISSLNIGHTQVDDLTPLRGMPLRQLLIHFTRVTDLSPLQGMQIHQLNLCVTPVTNLSVLQGMPLVSVRLHGCRHITDLSPLAGASTLNALTLPPDAKDFEFLRAFTNLDRLGYWENSNWKPDQTATQFWQTYDAKKKTEIKQP